MIASLHYHLKQDKNEIDYLNNFFNNFNFIQNGRTNTKFQNNRNKHA